jgi:hypothetical protein
MFDISPAETEITNSECSAVGYRDPPNDNSNPSEKISFQKNPKFYFPKKSGEESRIQLVCQEFCVSFYSQNSVYLLEKKEISRDNFSIAVVHLNSSESFITLIIPEKVET